MEDKLLLRNGVPISYHIEITDAEDKTYTIDCGFDPITARDIYESYSKKEGIKLEFYQKKIINNII